MSGSIQQIVHSRAGRARWTEDYSNGQRVSCSLVVGGRVVAKLYGENAAFRAEYAEKVLENIPDGAYITVGKTPDGQFVIAYRSGDNDTSYDSVLVISREEAQKNNSLPESLAISWADNMRAALGFRPFNADERNYLFAQLNVSPKEQAGYDAPWYVKLPALFIPVGCGGSGGVTAPAPPSPPVSSDPPYGTPPTPAYTINYGAPRVWTTEEVEANFMARDVYGNPYLNVFGTWEAVYDKPSDIPGADLNGLEDVFFPMSASLAAEEIDYISQRFVKENGIPFSSLGINIVVLPKQRKTFLDRSSCGGNVIFLSPNAGNAPFLFESNYATAHETGHAVHFALMPFEDPDLNTGLWKEYRELRGMTDLVDYNPNKEDPGSRPQEIFAEDFRWLFGSDASREMPYMAHKAPPGEDVREFMLNLLAQNPARVADMLSAVREGTFRYEENIVRIP